MKNVQRRLSVGGKSKSHSLERSLGGIACVCWSRAAENSVMCCTGNAHSKTAILLFLKSVWISCESEGALSTEICSRLFSFFSFFFHRSGSCAGGLAHPGGKAAAASEFGPRQRGPGTRDQRALEETPGVP